MSYKLSFQLSPCCLFFHRQGYLKRCREYVGKLFTEDQLEVIFSNVEQVYEFQRDFLSELR